MVNKITSLNGLTIVFIFVFIYFVIFPEDVFGLTAPIANLLNVSNSVSPGLYGLIGFLVFAWTINRVWGPKQHVPD